jgi:hypothetical protein
VETSPINKSRSRNCHEVETQMPKRENSLRAKGLVFGLCLNYVHCDTDLRLRGRHIVLPAILAMSEAPLNTTEFEVHALNPGSLSDGAVPHEWRCSRGSPTPATTPTSVDGSHWRGTRMPRSSPKAFGRVERACLPPA